MNKDQIAEFLKDKTVRKISVDLKDRIEEYRNRQKKFSLQSHLNRCFVNGDQWTVLLPGSNELFEPLQDEGEVRLTNNIIKPIVNLFRAEIMSRSPTWLVHAYSGDEIKIEVANVGEQILRQYYYRCERDGTLRRNLDGIIIDGVSYLTVDYFKNAGNVIGINDGQILNQGRIVIRNINTLDLLAPDEYIFQKAPCVIEVVRMHRQEAMRFFDLENEPPEDSHDPMRLDKGRMADNDKDRDNLTAVYKCHFLPGNGALPDDGRFPKGLILVFMESLNRVVDIREFPYPFDCIDEGNPVYPYIDFHMDHRLEKHHSQGIPEQIIPLQTELNRTLSEIAEAKNYIGKPVWRIPRNSGIASEDDIPTYSGGILEYTAQQGIPPPEPIAMPPIQSYIQEIPRILTEASQAIHSASDIARAQQPGSVNSYSGLQLLTDIQAKVLTPFVREYSAKLSMLGKTLLMCEQKYTDYKKQLRVTDDIADRSVKYFYSNADLQGEIDVQVRIDVDAYNPALKIQQALQERQIGVIDNDEYKSRVYGEERNVVDKSDIMSAYRENESFLKGTPVDNRQTIAIDNHAIHLKIINKLINSDEFKMFDPRLQQAVYAHAYIHIYGMSQPQAVFQQIVMPVVTQLGVAPPPQIQPPVEMQQQSGMPKGEVKNAGT